MFAIPTIWWRDILKYVRSARFTVSLGICCRFLTVWHAANRNFRRFGFRIFLMLTAPGRFVPNGYGEFFGWKTHTVFGLRRIWPESSCHWHIFHCIAMVIVPSNSYSAIEAHFYQINTLISHDVQQRPCLFFHNYYNCRWCVDSVGTLTICLFNHEVQSSKYKVYYSILSSWGIVIHLLLLLRFEMQLENDTKNNLFTIKHTKFLWINCYNVSPWANHKLH